MMTKKLGAEFLGTFWLVLGVCGSAVLSAAFPDVGIGLLGVSLAFGLTVLTMAYPSPKPFRKDLQVWQDALLKFEAFGDRFQGNEN